MALSYQWYKGGSPITGATSATYTKTAADSDGGTYYCKVSNAFGSTNSNSAVVTVLSIEDPYLWVDSETNITETDGKVSQWLSNLGDGYGFVQTDADYRPVLYPTGAINRITPVRFTSDYMPKKTGTTTGGTGAASCAVLFTLNAYGGESEYVFRFGVIGFSLRYSTTNRLHMVIGQYLTPTSTTLTAGGTYLIVVTRSADGTANKLYLNGTLIATYGDYENVGGFCELGNAIYGAYDSSIFEAIAWPSELNQAQVTEILAYMNHKYDLELE